MARFLPQDEDLTPPSPKTPKTARFQALDLLATLVAVVHGDGTVLFANAALEDALGTSRRTIEGASVLPLFTEPHVLRAALDGARVNEYATLRYDAWLARGTADPMPVHVVVAQTEVPDEFVLELLPLEQQARQEREERLIDQALANKELIRNLAHEIKNPLGGIRGAAQLLEQELEKPGLHEYTQVVIKEADRLRALMEKLLVPQHTPRFSALNIHEVLERVRSLLRAEIPDELVVRRDYDTSLPPLLGDKEQLIQVMLNIVRNAAQAMQGQGTIILRTRIARRVTLMKKLHRLAVMVQIIDNGPGIPEYLQDKIFYPLVSGRPDGHGLGLTLAQDYVSQHQGSIEFDSEPGRTCFTVMLPLQ